MDREMYGLWVSNASLLGSGETRKCPTGGEGVWILLELTSGY